MSGCNGGMCGYQRFVDYLVISSSENLLPNRRVDSGLYDVLGGVLNYSDPLAIVNKSLGEANIYQLVEDLPLLYADNYKITFSGETDDFNIATRVLKLLLKVSKVLGPKNRVLVTTPDFARCCINNMSEDRVIRLEEKIRV